MKNAIENFILLGVILSFSLTLRDLFLAPNFSKEVIGRVGFSIVFCSYLLWIFYLSRNGSRLAPALFWYPIFFSLFWSFLFRCISVFEKDSILEVLIFLSFLCFVFVLLTATAYIGYKRHRKCFCFGSQNDMLEETG